MSSPPTTASAGGRRRLAPIAAGLVVLVLLVAISPFLPRPGKATGNQDLGAEVLDAIGTLNRHHIAAAHRPAGQQETGFAGFGADESTEFEIGSVTKTFTGVLLAQAIEKGEIAEDTTLGEVFGERAGNAGEVTMLQLATHTSGLPRLPQGDPWSTVVRSYLKMDPYTETADDLLRELSEMDKPEPVGLDAGGGEYSNFGVALLGMALAEVSGKDYADLLEERIFAPLGMADSYLPVTPAGLHENAPRGLGAGWIPAAPWTMGASAPAGGIRSTARDMETYLRAVHSGELAGAKAATTVRGKLDEHTGIGLNWMFSLDEAGKPEMAFHNGGTGGYRSVVGYTPAGETIVVLTDTTRSVDPALKLLDTEGGKS